jgi:hypothetical protein
VYMDIRVIGDSHQSRAACVHWMESMESFPNIEAFDLVIVALNTLIQEDFDQITEKLRQMCPHVFTVFTRGLVVRTPPPLPHTFLSHCPFRYRHENRLPASEFY